MYRIEYASSKGTQRIANVSWTRSKVIEAAKAILEIGCEVRILWDYELDSEATAEARNSKVYNLQVRF